MAALALAALSAGCGLNIQAPDLFVLTRTGQGSKLTLLVNDSGTIRCNGGRPRPLSDPLLLQARDLASGLGGDAQHHLRIPSSPDSFPDTAAASGRFPRLAQVELFALRAAHQACGLSAND
jgi:hypothetical protein